MSQRWWMFYLGGSNSAQVLLSTSTDGVEWGTQTILRSGQGTDFTLPFSICSDGLHLFYVYADNSSASFYYRYGTPFSNGSIGWSIGEKRVVDTNSGVTGATNPTCYAESPSNMFVAVDAAVGDHNSYLDVLRFNGSWNLVVSHSSGRSYYFPGGVVVRLTSGYGLVYSLSDSAAAIQVQTSPNGSVWTTPVSTPRSDLNFWDSGVISSGDNIDFNSETYSQQPAVFFNQCTYPCSSLSTRTVVQPGGGDAASTISGDGVNNLVLSYCRDTRSFTSTVDALVSTDGGEDWTNYTVIASLNHICGGHTFGTSPAVLVDHAVGAFAWVGPNHQLNFAQVILTTWNVMGTFLGNGRSTLCTIAGTDVMVASNECWSDYQHGVTFTQFSSTSSTTNRWAVRPDNDSISTVSTGGSTYAASYYHQYSVATEPTYTAATGSSFGSIAEVKGGRSTWLDYLSTVKLIGMLPVGFYVTGPMYAYQPCYPNLAVQLVTNVAASGLTCSGLTLSYDASAVNSSVFVPAGLTIVSWNDSGTDFTSHTRVKGVPGGSVFTLSGSSHWVIQMAPVTTTSEHSTSTTATTTSSVTENSSSTTSIGHVMPSVGPLAVFVFFALVISGIIVATAYFANKVRSRRK